MKRIGLIKRIGIGVLSAILVLNPVLPALATGTDEAKLSEENEVRSGEDIDVENLLKQDVLEEEVIEKEEETISETESESEEVIKSEEETGTKTEEEPKEIPADIALSSAVADEKAKARAALSTPLSSPVNKADAVQDEGKAVSIEVISVRQLDTELGEDGNSIEIQTAIYTADGGVPKDIAGNYSIWIYSTSSSPNRNLLQSEDNTYTKTLKNISSNKEFDVYAKLADPEGNVIAESAHTTIKTVKPTIKKAGIIVTESADEQPTGTITVEGLDKVAYYPKNDTGNKKLVEGNTITGLAPGEYYVFSPAYSDGNTYYLKTSAERVTVAGGGVIPEEKYIVRTSGDANVKFGKSEVEVKKNADLSLYIKPVNKDTHYIDTESISIDPAENVSDYIYNSSTGELFIENITGNITVSARSVEKQIATAIEVENVEFNGNGIYDETNPAIQTKLSVKVTDKNGDTVPKTRVYFKDDESEVSSVQNRETDENGIAVFTYTFEINRGNGATRADYKPVFALDSKFEGIKTDTQIHLVLQLKKDLELYTDQIIGTKPGENDGKVINVPDNYEIWIGEVHQGAIVIGDGGEWISPINGEFTGLSAGQHVLRAGAKVDDSNNTYCFASDYADFFIPRGVWNISVNVDESEYVRYTGKTVQTAEPGGTVYIYIEPEDGYEISEYFVDKPSYLSGGLYYSSKYGYVILDGISGNIVLTVKAVAVPAQEDDQDTQVDVQTDNQSVRDTLEDTNIQDTVVSKRQSLINTVAVPEGIAQIAVRQTVQGEDIVAAVKSATPAKGSTDSVPIPEVIRDTINGIEENAVPLAGNIDNSDNTTNNKAVIAINTLLLLLLSAGILYAIYRYNKRDENN